MREDPCDTPVTNEPSALLPTIANLSHFHREHEKFYASSPRETGITLQRHARTLLALADRWSSPLPAPDDVLSPYAGATDLNDEAALQLDGVLFMEGEGEPVELRGLRQSLLATADSFAAVGAWLSAAMEASWGVAATLIEIDGVADLLGERHRIIADDWQAAAMSSLVARLLRRAAEVLERVDLTPSGLRRDLSGPSPTTPARVYSAAEMIARAADLCSESAGMVHDNERRWRVFHQRVAAMVGSTAS